MSFDADLWKQPSTEIIRMYVNAFDLNYHKSEEEFFREFRNPSTSEVIKNRIHLINASYHTRVDVTHVGCFRGELFRETLHVVRCTATYVRDNKQCRIKLKAERESF